MHNQLGRAAAQELSWVIEVKAQGQYVQKRLMAPSFHMHLYTEQGKHVIWNFMTPLTT